MLAVFLTAVAVQRERVVLDILFKKVSGGRLYLLQPGVAKFEDLAAVDTDKVVVLAAAIGLFVEGVVLAELVFGYEFAVHQDIEGIVDRSPAHIMTGIFHLEVQFFGVEMIIAGIDDLKDRETLGRFALLVLLQVMGKKLFRFAE